MALRVRFGLVGALLEYILWRFLGAIKMMVLVYITSGGLLLAMFADVISTLCKIQNAEQESNPIAYQLMRLVGVVPAVWLVYACELVVTLTAAYLALHLGHTVQIVFVLLGGATMVVFGAVAHNNISGKTNQITRLLLRSFWHLRMVKNWKGGIDGES